MDFKCLEHPKYILPYLVDDYKEPTKGQNWLFDRYEQFLTGQYFLTIERRAGVTIGLIACAIFHAINGKTIHVIGPTVSNQFFINRACIGFQQSEFLCRCTFDKILSVSGGYIEFSNNSENLRGRRIQMVIIDSPHIQPNLSMAPLNGIVVNQWNTRSVL